MATAFFCFYLAAAFVHIAAIHFEKPFVRSAAKMCLMPVLMAFVIFQTNGFPALVLSALLFSWFGDMLLLKPQKLHLYLGIGSFLLAHIFYLITYVNFIYKVNIPVASFSVIVVRVMMHFIFRNLRLPKDFLIPLTLYGTAIALLVLFSLQVFMNNRNRFGFLLLAGSVSFVISDITLAYHNTVKPKTKLSQSFVMASYVVAQAAISIACINLRLIG